jgi:hypothetical protein
MNAAMETRIRERAYEIWEREGCGHGWALDHWLQAEEEIAARPRRGKQRGGAKQSTTEAAGSAGKTKRAKATKRTAARLR